MSLAVLLLCFVALLSVNGTYATDGNTSNISNNITSINDTELTSFTEETTTIENISTENTTVNVTENSTDNSDTTDNTTDNVTSTSSESGAAGDASTGETLDNVESLFVWSTSLSTINPTSLVNAGITDVYVYVPRTNIAVIQSFIEKFSGTGIRVWAWIPCFVDSDGNWLIAGESTINGEDSREWLKDEIDSIASTYGISGVLLDYCRYPGTAYKHPTEEEATAIITNFVSDVRSMLDTIGGTKGSYIYLGIAVMPECSVNTYYYGQSYEQLSQYVDCLIPMVYKGNYGEDSSWIGTVTSYIVSHSTVPVITAVQTYESDSNTTPLSSSELTTDVQTAVDNGSSGYALFRYGLISSYPVITIPVSLTIEEILEASEIVKNYIETNKKLPTTITIGTHNINIAQFLYLATKATVALNNGQSTATSITVGSYTLPSTSYENLKTGALTTGTYVDFANRIAQYIAESSQAPPYGIIGLGEISYQSQVYLYSRVLTSYKNNGQLPNTMTVKTWTTSNIPINEPTSYTFTIDQILTAAQTVKNYIETNKKLPTTVTIGTTSINMAQFLFLAVTATNDLNNGQTTSTTVTVSSNYKLPSSSYESMVTGALTTGTYVDFANRIAQYIAENYQAPPYGLIGLGQISYQSQIYLYSRVLSSYKNNGQLPNTMTVKTWTTSNIPINEPTSYTFTINQILTAAQTVKTYIETNKKLPTTVTIGTTSINMAQFLFLAAAATNDLNKGNPTTTTVTVSSNYQLPSSSSESLKTGTLTTSNYVDFANRIAQYMAENYQAPPYGLIGLGQISYQSQIYLYSRVLSSYKNNGQLPSSITLKSWSTSNIPITEPMSFTIAEVLTAAQTVKNYIETNKTLPTTITIGTTSINMAQFLYLATQATVALNNGKSTTTTVTTESYTLPTSSIEELDTELLFSADYVDLASRISEFISNNQVAPTYGLSSIGKIGYKSQIYLFSRILDYYKTNKVLPSNIVVKTWSTSNIPTTGINVSFSIDDIADTATGVKNNVELYSELPTTANVAGVRINIAQFLYLATVATVQIKSNNDDPISLDNYNVSSSSYENMSSGNLSLAEYLDFASRIAQYMEENKETPSYGVVSLGDLSYHTQIYLFSRVLDQYNTNGALPSSISLQPWVTVIYGIPAEYSKYMVATTNCQSDNSQIIALANSITSSASTAYEKAVAIFNWVRDNIGYSFYYNTKYGAVGTLSAGSGNCVDTSHLLIALLRAASIPARYVHGYCNFSSGSWYGHVWAEVYVNGQWYSADASSSRNTFGVINSWNTATATIYNRYATLPF